MTSILDALHRDVLTDIFQFLHCKDLCQLDRAVTNRRTRPYLHDAYQYTKITQLQISCSACLSANDSFAGVFFPESLISLNVLGNLSYGWDTLHIKKSQMNALQWIVDRKLNLKLILFDFCTEFDETTFAMLSNIPSIETVECKNCHLKQSDLISLFHHLPRIKKLSFHTRISPSFVDTMNHSCSSLHTLFLTFGYGSELKAIGVLISNCPSLVVLHVRKMHTAVLPHGNDLICGRATTLNHFNCEIDGGVRELQALDIGENFPNLRTLVLTVPNKHISNQYMEQISSQLKHLQWFGIRYAKMNKRAISSLLNHCRSLQRLDIYCCRMDGNPFTYKIAAAAAGACTSSAFAHQEEEGHLLALEHLEFVWNNYEYPGYIYSSHRAPFTAEELGDILALCPHLRHLKCTDPGPHNSAFRDAVTAYATAPGRSVQQLQVKYIRY